jgi:nicotinamidase-related amidase
MSRMEFVLQRAGIDTLVFAGIVTNGGVASTVRDAHVRDYKVMVLHDGCAAFSVGAHNDTIASLRSVVEISDCAAMLGKLAAR